MNKVAGLTKLWAEENKIPFLFYRETDSTNKQAKKKFPSKHRLFIAEKQTHGRGQKERKWVNSDLMVSWSFMLKSNPQPDFSVLQAGVLSLALKTVWGLPVKIKPPNDILIQDQKLAGFLIEMISQSQCLQLIIGVGMNVFSHPVLSVKECEGSRMQATHLRAHLKKEGVVVEKWGLFLDYWYKGILSSISPFC